MAIVYALAPGTTSISFTPAEEFSYVSDNFAAPCLLTKEEGFVWSNPIHRSLTLPQVWRHVYLTLAADAHAQHPHGEGCAR